MTQQALLDRLTQRTQDNRAAAVALLELPDTTLNYRPAPERWSALECYAHLNLSLSNYLPAFAHSISNGQPKTSADYQPGRIGNYMAKALLPNPKTRKMKAPDWMKPTGSALNKSTLREFIGKQDEFISLLVKADAVDLRLTKCRTRLPMRPSFQLGDVLRMIAYHNSRHVVQAAGVLAHFDQMRTAG